MCGLAAKKYGSQLAGHQKNAHVHTHARTHIHTTPFFAPFGRSCVSPVTEDNKGGPGTAGLQQAREGKKEWKGVSKYNQKRDLGRGDQGDVADRVMDPSWGGEKVGEKDGADSHNWRKWRTQVGSSCNQTACDLLKESNYIQTLSACPPGRTAGPLTRWSRAWETSGHHKETTTRKERRRGGERRRRRIEKRGRVRVRRGSRGLWDIVGTTSCAAECVSSVADKFRSGDCKLWMFSLCCKGKTFKDFTHVRFTDSFGCCIFK